MQLSQRPQAGSRPDAFDPLDVLLVLADVLDDLGIRKQSEWNRDAPGLRVGLRVVDRELDLQVPEILAPEALGHAHRFRHGMPAVVQPGLAVEPDGVDDEDVAVPFADRITEPRRAAFDRMVAAVREDLTEVSEVLEEDDRQAGCLDDLPGVA